jgi:hypothetical protein
MRPDIELQFVESFVTKDKLDRLRGFFKSTKARWKGLLELEHFHPGTLDARLAQDVPRSHATPEAIIQLLRQQGAPSECYVFSNCSEIDGRFMTLDEAIRQVHGIGIGTVVSCIHGRLAFFEGELFPDQHILSNLNSRL